MRDPDDPLSDERLEAGKAELRRVVAQRMFRETERVPYPVPTDRPQWVARPAPRLSERAQFWLIGLLVIAGALFLGSLMESETECPSGTALVWERSANGAYSDGLCYATVVDEQP